MKVRPRRQPRGIETHLALDKLQAAFDGAPQTMIDATARSRGPLAAEIAQAVADAARRGELVALLDAPHPPPDTLVADVKGVLQNAYQAGKLQVRDELRRQKEGAPADALVAKHAAVVRIGAAEKPKRRKPAIPPPTPVDEAAAVATITALAAVDAAAVTTAMYGAAAQEALRGTVDETALAAVAETAGLDESLSVSATVSRIIGAGRAAGGRTYAGAGLVSKASYSAILDANTCEACESMDGTETTDLDEAESWTPNGSCMGGDRCRCVTVFELANDVPPDVQLADSARAIASERGVSYSSGMALALSESPDLAARYGAWRFASL